MCSAGGVKHTRIRSSNSDVLASIPEEERKVGVKNVDLLPGQLPEEKASGVFKKVKENVLGFKIKFTEKSVTRVLIAIPSSVFDLLGLLAPLLLKGSKIIEDLWQGKLKWYDQIPEEFKYQCIKWRNKLASFNSIQFTRFYKPRDFGKVVEYSLYHFFICFRRRLWTGKVFADGK